MNIIKRLREQRGGMVQTKDQYVYIYRAMVRYGRILELLGDLNPTITSNTALVESLRKADRWVDTFYSLIIRQTLPNLVSTNLAVMTQFSIILIAGTWSRSQGWYYDEDHIVHVLTKI